MKKTITTFFAIIFLIIFVLVAKKIGVSVYHSFTRGSSTSYSEEQLSGERRFSCLSDSTITTRSYVYLRGFGNESELIDEQRKEMKKDPKFNGLLDFSYDVNESLESISKSFLDQVVPFIKNSGSDEIVMIGQSAGGTILAHNAHALPDNPAIELHTMASPLRGYHTPSFAIKEETGYSKDIAAGIDPFKSPKNNIAAVHHKTVTDETLASACKGFEAFCNTLKAQDNNLKGSDEFFYPEHDHNSIMHAVSSVVIACQK